MAGATDYLKLRGYTWYVRVQVPQNLWKAAGTREFVKSLRTRDLAIANKRKHAQVALLKGKIAAFARQGTRGPALEIYNAAIALRDAIDRQGAEVLDYETNPDSDRGEKVAYTMRDEYLTDITDKAREIADTHGDEQASKFFRIARGEGTLLRERAEQWLTELAVTATKDGAGVTAQTRAQHSTVLERFFGWASDDVLLEDVNRKKAGSFVSHLLTEGGLAQKTVQRYISTLSAFWTWLERRGDTEQTNPWLRHGVGAKGKRGHAEEARQWDDKALVMVLTGEWTPDYELDLHDLAKLALMTGARLDELCELKNEDVTHRADGWWFKITQGKTRAAVRDVPVHNSVAHILKRRHSSKAEYLFAGLVPGGPDRKRSWNVSKAFGRYTKSLKLGDDRKTFHALRNTFMEALEGAGVPESTVKLIVGHTRQSETFGRYSKGKRVNLRPYIDKLRYSTEVMRLIRAAPTDMRRSAMRARRGAHGQKNRNRSHLSPRSD